MPATKRTAPDSLAHHKQTMPIYGNRNVPNAVAGYGIIAGVISMCIFEGNLEDGWADTPADAKEAELPNSPDAPAGIKATDKAVELALAEGVDLATVEGTGAGGNIKVSDVLAAIKARDEE